MPGSLHILSLPVLTGFFLGLWLHCEPLNLLHPSAAA